MPNAKPRLRQGFGGPARRSAQREGGPRHLFLVDGSGYIFRAFHALPPMTREDGTPVNAVFGFVAMLLKLRDDTDADSIAVIFDTARVSFRNKIYPDYKAHRPEPPPELVPQFALIREATRALGLPAVELAGYEADDLIATYAREAERRGAEVTIVSSDKDLMQLVDDRITMLDPIKNRKIGREEVKERFGVGPERVVDVQALAGDSSDNVPGVPGIGVKTAAELINGFGDLDAVLARAGEIKQPKRRQSLLENADKARLSRELVRLKDDVPVREALESFAVRAPDAAALLSFLRAQGFKSIIARLEGRLGAAAEPAAPSRASSSRARPLSRPGSSGRASADSSPSTPRPPRSTPCAPSWWVSRSRSSPAARATSRSGTRARRADPRPGKSRSPLRSSI